MPQRAPRILTLLLATAGVCLATTAAGAQTAPTAGRYLTWANRPAGTTPASFSTASVSPANISPTEVSLADASPAAVGAAQPRPRNAMIPRRVAPSQAPYRPMAQPTPTPQPTSRGLMPASAWLGPRIAPSFAPGSPNPLAYTEMAAPTPVYSAPPSPIERPTPQPQPQPQPEAEPEPQPEPQPVERAAVDPMAPRRDAPVFNLQRPAQQPAAQPSVEEAPTVPQRVAAADTIDPMAPRRDARIFQIQQAPTEGQGDAAASSPGQSAPPTATPAQPGQSGARYYSVHRDAGRRPDATALPEPVYFDSVSLDLAEPPATEIQPRDAQGRRRAAVANEDPSLP